MLGILETRTQAARQPPTSRGPAGASRVGTEGDRWWITVRGPGREGGSRAECATWAPACDHRAALRLGRRGGRRVQVLQGEMAEPTWVVPCWTSEGPGAGCTVSLCFKVDSVTRVSLGLTLLCTASGLESTHTDVPGERGHPRIQDKGGEGAEAEAGVAAGTQGHSQSERGLALGFAPAGHSGCPAPLSVGSVRAQAAPSAA